MTARRSLLAVAACALATGLALNPARAEPSVTIVPLGFAVTHLRGPTSRVAATVASTDAFRGARPPLSGPLCVVWGEGGGAVLRVEKGEVQVTPARRGSRDFGALERGRGALADSRIQSTGPFTAQLEEPTRDYPHEALGTAFHAKVLSIVEKRPAAPSSEPRRVAADTTRIPAGPGAVFEDREPRLADLDGDGTPEILVVRAYLKSGAALAIVARSDGSWRIAAETPPDGEPFRWLNPVAPAPSPGGARQGAEIVLVRRPHLDGLLQVWSYQAGKLTLSREKAGYSNHAYGSPAQDLAAIVSGEGGERRLIVPTLDRRALAILTLAGDLRELGRVPLPARAERGLAAFGSGRDLTVLVGLEDGRVAAVRP